jgi:hypothetical protein
MGAIDCKLCLNYELGLHTRVSTVYGVGSMEVCVRNVTLVPSTCRQNRPNTQRESSNKKGKAALSCRHVEARNEEIKVKVQWN